MVRNPQEVVLDAPNISVTDSSERCELKPVSKPDKRNI